MNVLLIQSDQQRWDTIGAGSVAITPNLDRLAARGVRFEACYANAPLCVPSRASSVTGRWPHEAGCYGNAAAFDGRTTTYAHILNDNGILAADIGRMDFARGAEHGFDASREHPRQEPDVFEYMRDPMAQRVGGYRSYCWDTGLLEEDRFEDQVAEICGWLERHAGDAEPWCLVTNFNLPHPPFEVPRKYFEMYDPADTPLPHLPEGYLDNLHEAVRKHRYHWDVETPFPDENIRLKRTIYYAMNTWLDDIVGVILGKLDELGLAEDTLVIFTSDHAENLGDHGMWAKGSFYDTSCRIPMIMAGPDIPSGGFVKTPVSLIDLAPTILDAFSVETPADMHGRSLLPLAGGKADAHPGVVYGQYHGHDAVTGEFMVRTARWKSIYHVGMPPQLFDMEADPEELNDLASEPSCASAVEEMESRLREAFDPEELDRQAKECQAERFKRWLQETDTTDVKNRLLEDLGEAQYRRLAEHYPLPPL